MRELDASTFDQAIGGTPVLVDFWAPWCRPCLALEPVLAQLEDRVPVAKLNIDENPELASRFEILSVPTVLLFSGGERRAAVVGLRPLAHFERWLTEVLPAGKLEGLAVAAQHDA